MTKRVVWFAGQLITAEDLREEQQYHRDRQRRHVRWLHGSGVVGGLDVEVVGAQVRVGAGLAIDCQGNEIEVVAPVAVKLPKAAGTRFVCLRYAERPTDAVPLLTDGASEASTAFARVEETFEITLEPTAKRGGVHRRGRGPPCAEAHPLPIARLHARGGRWHRDRRFRPHRLRAR